MFLEFVYTRNKSAKVLTESFSSPLQNKIWYLSGNGISQIHAEISEINTDTSTLYDFTRYLHFCVPNPFEMQMHTSVRVAKYDLKG